MTLIELMVGMTLSLLLLGAVLLAFSGSTRLMQWVGVRTDVASSAMLGLNMLSRELRTSAYTTITVINAPEPALCFEIEDPNPADAIGGTFAAAPYVVIYYYNAATDAVVRKVWWAPGQAAPAPTPPPSGTHMQGPDVNTVIGLTNGTEHNVATGVINMSISPSTYPTTSTFNGITVTLSIEKQVTSKSWATQAVTTTIFPRNHQ